MRIDGQSILFFYFSVFKTQNKWQAAKVTDDQTPIKTRLARLQLTASILNDIAICEITAVGEWRRGSLSISARPVRFKTKKKKTRWSGVVKVYQSL